MKAERMITFTDEDRARIKETVELAEADDGHAQLAGQRLDAAADLADLVLPALGAGRAHELEVVDEDRLDAVPGVQPA